MPYDENGFIKGKHAVHGALMLHVRCRRNKGHKLGTAVKYLTGHSLDPDGIVLGEGMRWEDDRHLRVVIDCKKCAAESPLVPVGTDQRISRERLLAEFARMWAVSEHDGVLRL